MLSILKPFFKIHIVTPDFKNQITPPGATSLLHLFRCQPFMAFVKDPHGFHINRNFRHVPMGEPESKAIEIVNCQYSPCLSIGNHESSGFTLNSILVKNYGLLRDNFAVYPVESKFLPIETFYCDDVNPRPTQMSTSALTQSTNNSQDILPIDKFGNALSGDRNIENNRAEQALDVSDWKKHLKNNSYNSIFKVLGVFVCYPLLSSYPNWKTELKSQYAGTIGGDIGGIVCPVRINHDSSSSCRINRNMEVSSAGLHLSSQEHLFDADSESESENEASDNG
jgi:hypothetical protein